ncbi:hypothetical protein [Coleofasciculus sp. E1-EBD-02]|uniref:hypothetical protein n=1 Tax=Coleofasciculus sp. E1-EBD-02 TaxID=3068481 RepID=UPI0032F27D00
MGNNFKEPGQLLWAEWGINLDEVPFEQLDHYIAVENYLMDDDDPPSDATDLENVERYTKSLHHLCKSKDWNRVQSILTVPISINTTAVSFALPLCDYLIFKGISPKVLELTNEIINSFQDTGTDLRSIRILKAKALGKTGNLPEASRIYEELCLNSSQNSEIYIEAKAHLAISQVQRELYQEGIPNLKCSLRLIESFLESANNLGSKAKFLELKTDILSNFAYCKMNLGKFKEARIQYSQVLQILEEQGMFHKIINPLVHQGIIERKEFRINKSIATLEKARAKAIEVEDKPALVWIEHHLSWAFRMNKNYKQAEVFGKKSLDGYKNMEDQRGITDSYELLGFIFIDKGENHKAVKNFKGAFNWRKENGKMQGAASCIMGLAISYWRQRQFFKFIKTLFEGLNLYRKAGVLNWSRIYRLFKFTRVFPHLLLRNKKKPI